MDVHLIADGTVEHHTVDELAALLEKDDALSWLDIPVCDDVAAGVLTDVFGFHPLAVKDCVQRNRVPKLHAYADHSFFVLHGPERGRAGHVHYIELDQFVGRNYLVTVHGPMNPAVPQQAARREVDAVVARIEAGRLRPASSFELSYAIVSAMARHMESFMEGLTEEVWQLEQRVTGGHLGNPEEFLEQLFRTRHGLLSVGTIATQNREIFERLCNLARAVPSEAVPLLRDGVDQFGRISSLARAQKDYLHGVIEFYRTRTDTKMMIAAERLTVVAVVTLPVTALASVYGMNVIVNAETDAFHVGLVVVVMIAMSALLLVWAKRQGWW
ncbi:MAG: magnesium transporter CorA family protein [Acidimicrobiales bacterium]